MTIPEDFILSCPIPIQQYPTILLAHGGGGKLMHQLTDLVQSQQMQRWLTGKAVF